MSILTDPSFTVSLTVKDAGEALEFYKKALGIEEVFRMADPSGSPIYHAEFMLGDLKMYLSCESPDWGALALPKGIAAPCLFAVVSERCDEAVQRAINAGAELISEPTDQIYARYDAVQLLPV